MAKVNTGRMEMDTDVARKSGSSMSATGGQSASAAEQIIQRINDNEVSIGTGAAADNFHQQYNWPATGAKDGTRAAAKMLTDLGNSLTETAGNYEAVDQEYRRALDRIGRA
jgi:uncharacterized protein YukE